MTEKVTEEEFAHIHEIMTSFKDLETNDLYPTLVSDDPDSEEDISRWVNRNGHELLSLNKSNKDLEFTIKKAK